MFDLFSAFCKRKINGLMIPLLKDRYKLLLDSFFSEKEQHNPNITFIIYQDLFEKR